MTKFLNQTRQYGSLLPKKKPKREIFKFTVPQGEGFHSCRLTTLETHFGGSATIDAEPAAGKVGKCEIVVSWQCEGVADVKLQIEAFSTPADNVVNADSVTAQMTNFLPSRNGWSFDNRFVRVPPFKLIGDLKYGDASKGLCGGMVYSALDYFMAGLDLPSIPETDLSKYKSPVQGSTFDYLGKRLFNSFDIPDGVLKYIELMSPDFPDFQTGKKYSSVIPRNRAWCTIRQEWPAIKSRLDAGQPCPLGLIRIKSNDVLKLGENHQVLAYGYDQTGDDLTLFIYDPNYSKNDKVTMKLNIGNPERKLNIQYSDNHPVHCFFRTHYTFSMPPAKTILPGRIILFEEENFCGRSIDVLRGNPNLGTNKVGNFRNSTSSIVVLSGKWSFYRKVEYKEPIRFRGAPLVLEPGAYRRVSDFGIQDNAIISLQAVNTTMSPRQRQTVPLPD